MVKEEADIPKRSWFRDIALLIFLLSLTGTVWMPIAFIFPFSAPWKILQIDVRCATYDVGDAVTKADAQRKEEEASFGYDTTIYERGGVSDFDLAIQTYIWLTYRRVCSVKVRDGVVDEKVLLLMED